MGKNPPQPTVGLDKAVEIAESGSLTYVGLADAGSLTEDPSWQIKLLTEATSGLTIQFADGDELFDNIWDDVTTLSYS